MGRLIEHDATGPRKLDGSDLDPRKGDVAICLCGLSEEYPFCDGSHRLTAGEADDGCYRYVEEGEGLRRREVDSVVLVGRLDEPHDSATDQ